MLDRLIDRLGNSNPQIFRELKERLTWRNISIAILAALAIQGLVLLYYSGQIPTPRYDTTNGASILLETRSRYCNFSNTYYYYQSELCKLSQDGFAINWRLWWTDVFVCLSWILPMGAILGSVYLLVADLIQEEKRGTLNFIRLSPQSTHTIFSGKILGVPSLVYLAVALILPLHLWAGLNGGASLPLMAAWYAGITSIWFLLSSASILYVLFGGIQAILTALAVSWPLSLPMMAINSYASATMNGETWLTENSIKMSWFGIPLGNSAIGFYLFGTVSCLVACYWVWQALDRRYLNPTATAIGKSQSYLINFCWQVWIAGLALPFAIGERSYYNESAIVSFAILDFIALVLLIPLLLPSRQALQDWSRHRRERVTHAPRSWWQRELFQDLIRNDKSPALLAIAINIGMAMLLWLPVALITFSRLNYGVRFLAGICVGGSLILIYAAIAHLGLFLNVKNRNLWIVAIVCGTAILPSIAAFVLSPGTPTGLAGVMLLFSPLAPLGIVNLAGGTILTTFFAQLGIFGILTRQLHQNIQASGRSQTKELLSQS